MAVKMTAGTLVAVVMVTVDLTTVSNGQCQKLDQELWDETFCPFPESDDWFYLKLKMNCGTDQHYHCASNSQGCFVQMCANRIFCEPGHRPLLDPDNGTVICALCPPDRFQPEGVWSNEQSDCQYEKTECNGNGQIECQPGSETTDRSCRCNISQNLALQYYALHNKTCCTRNDVFCECIPFKSSCPNGTVRHENYKCLEECLSNSFRYWYSETCYPNSTTLMVEMATNNQMNTSDHQMPLPDPTGSIDVGVVVGPVIAVLVLVGLTVGLCKHHRWKKKNKNHTPNDEEQNVPLTEQISGRSGERTVNGNIDGHESEEKANGHLVHVEDSNSQETTSVSGRSGERTVNGNIDGHESEEKANGHLVHVEDSNSQETTSVSALVYCFKCRQKRKNEKGGMEAPQTVHNHEDNRNHIEMTHLLQEENNSSNIQKIKKEKDISQNITINAQFVNLGDKNSIKIKDGKKLTWNCLESQNESHGASSLSTEENPVSVTPGESIPEESSRSHDINMDIGPKHPVEHEERDSALVEEDNQTKRKEVWTPTDQTKRKKVPNQPKIVIDDQTKRKEVWTSPEVVPDDQTKRKEVWTSPEIEQDDQTKRKEVWTSREVIPDEQTKRKEVWISPEVVPDVQAKRKEVWCSLDIDQDDQTKRKEVWTSPED